MKSEKIIWGLVLVFIGAVFLLDNFDVIDFYWRSVWRFWPIILILIGANMMFNYSDSKVGAGAAAAVAVVCLGFLFYQGTRPYDHDKSWFSFRFDNDDRRDRSGRSAQKESNFVEEYNPASPYAELNVSGGATEFDLVDSTSNLFEAFVRQTYGSYNLTRSSKDSMEVINFKQGDNKGRRDFNFNDADANHIEFKLNPNPIWKIYLKMGAGEADFDFSKYKVSELHLKGGAASFDVKLPEPSTAQTTVEAEAGVAEVKLSVPANTPCKIIVSGGLSDKNFNGFTKQSNDVYVSGDYEKAPKRIFIRLKVGLSDFTVDKY